MTTLTSALRRIAELGEPSAASHGAASPPPAMISDPAGAQRRASPLPTGRVHLFCEPDGAGGCASVVAAQQCDAAFSLSYSLLLSSEAAEEFVAVAPIEAAPSATQRGGVCLPLRACRARPRHWVRFLHDCRRDHGTTGLVASSSSDAWLVWLASRCDQVTVLTPPEQPDAESRRLSRRLGRLRPRPACVMVQAA